MNLVICYNPNNTIYYIENKGDFKKCYNLLSNNNYIKFNRT